MATITLDYDNYNVEAQKVLHNVLSLGFFRVRKMKKQKKTEDRFLYSISEQVLAKDWLSKEEDEAWKDL